MSPAAGAYADGMLCGGCDVEDNIVRPGFVAAYACGNVVQLQGVPRTPGNIVVGAGGVAADSKGADQLPGPVVERKAAAKYVHPANARANHWIVLLPVVTRIATVSYRCVYRITGLEAEEAAAGLRDAVQVGGGERQLWQAEGVGGVGFLGGNHAAAGPLVATVCARESNSADHAIAIHDGPPHVQIEASIGLLPRRKERVAQLTVRRELLGGDYVDFRFGHCFRRSEEDKS